MTRINLVTLSKGRLETLGRLAPGIVWDPLAFIASVALAIGAAAGSLWIAYRLRQRTPRASLIQAAAAILMGLAIAGMHYTGMAAADFPAVRGVGGRPRLAGRSIPIPRPSQYEKCTKSQGEFYRRQGGGRLSARPCRARRRRRP